MLRVEKIWVSTRRATGSRLWYCEFTCMHCIRFVQIWIFNLMTNIIRHFGRRFDRSTLYMPKVKILDGGSVGWRRLVEILLNYYQATQLEFYNVDLSGSLWSASALTNCPHLVERMHKDFIEAGADVSFLVCICCLLVTLFKGYRELYLSSV